MISNTSLALFNISWLFFFSGNVTAYFPGQRPSILVERISTMLSVTTPAYMPTPQSSVASSMTTITAEKPLQPNGKHINFAKDPPSENVIKKGFINKAFGSKPLASFRKHKYRPEGTIHQINHTFFTSESGIGPYTRVWTSGWNTHWEIWYSTRVTWTEWCPSRWCLSIRNWPQYEQDPRANSTGFIRIHG